MSERDKRDMAGQIQNVPMRGQGQRDTRDTPFRGGVPVSRMSPADRLRSLSRQIGRLSPNWQNPETFFEDRDQIERAMRALANEVARG